jgi:hypothetical protein
MTKSATEIHIELGAKAGIAAAILNKIYGDNWTWEVGGGCTVEVWRHSEGHVWALTDEFLGLYEATDSVDIFDEPTWGMWLEVLDNRRRGFRERGCDERGYD